MHYLFHNFYQNLHLFATTTIRSIQRLFTETNTTRCIGLRKLNQSYWGQPSSLRSLSKSICVTARKPGRINIFVTRRLRSKFPLAKSKRSFGGNPEIQDVSCTIKPKGLPFKLKQGQVDQSKCFSLMKLLTGELVI